MLVLPICFMAKMISSSSEGMRIRVGLAPILDSTPDFSIKTSKGTPNVPSRERAYQSDPYFQLKRLLLTFGMRLLIPTGLETGDKFAP